MKQAVLITAYKDFDQLKLLINQFDNDYTIYIHIDKKSSLSKAMKLELLSIENVKYLGQDYKVNWGGINHLLAYLKLSTIALSNKENHYFHLITGQDFPVKPKVVFKSLDKDYITYCKMPAPFWKDGGFDRLELFNFYDVFNAKKSRKWIFRINKIQRKLKYKRPINKFLGELYCGGTYWSLTRGTLEYVISFTKKNKRFLRRFKYTLCAEEIYFQTVIMNSKYSENVINDDLRYIDWESNKGGRPALLDEKDFEKVMKSNKIFVRKTSLAGNKLIQMLIKYNTNLDQHDNC